MLGHLEVCMIPLDKVGAHLDVCVPSMWTLDGMTLLVMGP